MNVMHRVLNWRKEDGLYLRLFRINWHWDWRDCMSKTTITSVMEMLVFLPFWQQTRRLD
jgi:hypothetical protein